jgi:hypothetical protein
MVSITRESSVVSFGGVPGKPAHPIRYGKRKAHTTISIFLNIFIPFVSFVIERFLKKPRNL